MGNWMQWTPEGRPQAAIDLSSVAPRKQALAPLCSKNVPNIPAVERRIDRHAHMSGHPNGQVRHEPPGAVSGEDRDARFRFPVLRLKIGGHAAGFLAHLPPIPLTHLTAAIRLSQKDAVRPLPLPAIQPRKRQIVLRYKIHESPEDARTQRSRRERAWQEYLLFALFSIPHR